MKVRMSQMQTGIGPVQPRDWTLGGKRQRRLGQGKTWIRTDERADNLAFYKTSFKSRIRSDKTRI